MQYRNKIYICPVYNDTHQYLWFHDNVIEWKLFPRYWPIVRGISSICAWTNGWANNRDAGDLSRHRTQYDVTVMYEKLVTCWRLRSFKQCYMRTFPYMNLGSVFEGQFLTCSCCEFLGYISTPFATGSCYATFLISDTYLTYPTTASRPSNSQLQYNETRMCCQ